MRRRLPWILALVLLVCPTLAAAADPTITLEVDGRVVPTDVPPMLVEGRTMLKATLPHGERSDPCATARSAA